MCKMLNVIIKLFKCKNFIFVYNS